MGTGRFMTNQTIKQYYVKGMGGRQLSKKPMKGKWKLMPLLYQPLLSIWIYTVLPVSPFSVLRNFANLDILQNKKFRHNRRFVN